MVSENKIFLMSCPSVSKRANDFYDEESVKTLLQSLMDAQSNLTNVLVSCDEDTRLTLASVADFMERSYQLLDCILVEKQIEQ